MKRAITVVLVIVFLCALLMGCNGKNALLGAWIAEGGKAPDGYPDEIEFFKEDRCIADGMPAAYSVENGRLLLVAFGGAASYSYKVSGDTLTLDDGSERIQYEKAGTGTGSSLYDDVEDIEDEEEKSDASEKSAYESTSEDSEEDEQRLLFESDLAAAEEKLDAFDADGDVEGALSYAIEQLNLMDITWPDQDFSSLEQRKEAYVEPYRAQTLQAAKSAYESDGYEAALSLLNKSLSLLDPDDEDINDAIKYYNGFGPARLVDLDYFQSIAYMDKTVKSEKTDNTGVEHEDVLAMTDGSTDLRGLIYLIDGKYRTFSGTVFLDQEYRDTKGKFVLRVYGDDRLLFTSQTQTAGSFPEEFSVDVTGVTQLKLEMDSSGNWLCVYLADGMLNP